jgi:two-component system, response regulator PdtaR
VKKIFLIDDDFINNALNEIIIGDLFPDVHIFTFHNGFDALSILEKEEIVPDLILLDLNMPLMSGFEFLEKINEGRITIPVAILSSSKNPRDIERVNQYNTVGYLEKPLTEKSFLSLVNKKGRN